jgi:hypothetical protein
MVDSPSRRHSLHLLARRGNQVLTMSAKEDRPLLLGALVLMALAALMLHLRIHPFLAPDKAHPGEVIFRGAYVTASLFPLMDLILVTTLFCARRTAVYGYLLNGLIVVYGTVLMAHFMIAKLGAAGAPLMDWLLWKSTLPDIALAWADFLVGALLYRSWVRGD